MQRSIELSEVITYDRYANILWIIQSEKYERLRSTVSRFSDEYSLHTFYPSTMIRGIMLEKYITYVM